MKNKFTSSNLKIVLLFVAVSLSSIISLIKDLVFSSQFGATSDADAYNVATQIPLLIFSVATISIQGVLIPFFSKVLYKDGKEKADRFFSGFLNLVIILSVLICLLGIVFSNELVELFAVGFSDSTKQITAKILRIAFVAIIFTGAIDTINGALNVYKTYVIPKFVNMIRNVFLIIFILFLNSRFGIFSAIFGFVIGCFVECFVSILLLKDKVKYSLSLKSIKNNELKKAFIVAVPILIGSIFGEITGTLDKIVASFLVPGSISSINYANRLSLSISTLISSSIITVVFPLFSKKVSQNDSQGLKAAFKNTCYLIFIVLIPIIFGGCLLSKDLIMAVFGRGAITSNDVLNISSVFGFYLISAFFSTINTLCVKVYASNRRTFIPVIINFATALLNVGLNFLLGIVFNFGIIGIAFSTLFSSFCACLLILLFTCRLVKLSITKNMVFQLLKLIFSSLLMVCLLQSLSSILPDFNLYIKIMIKVFLGFSVYASSCYFFKIKKVVIEKR